MNNRINFMCTGTAEKRLWRVEEFLPSTAGMRQKKKISAGTADIFLDWIDFVLLHFMRKSRRKDIRMDLLIHKSSGEGCISSIHAFSIHNDYTTFFAF
jgi:hypothetical protein